MKEPSPGKFSKYFCAEVALAFTVKAETVPKAIAYAQRTDCLSLEADGLPVMDDVGGIGGYIDFLRTIHGSSDEDEEQEARDRASSLGRTGRMIKPQNIL